MILKAEPAVCSGGSPKQTADKNYIQHTTYRKAKPMSKENLPEQIGLLLWFLCSPISDRQIEAGYRLLEILLSAIYERGLL